MSASLTIEENGEADLRPFWVWFDPLLEDHFGMDVSDEEAEPLLDRLALEGIAATQVDACGVLDAIQKVFPHRRERTKISPRAN